MNFKLTHFIFIFSFFSLVQLNSSFALDLYVKDSYVSSRVKYTLSNDSTITDLKLVLTDPNQKDYLVSEINTINLSNSSYEDFISQVFFNKAGKYVLSAFQNNILIASDQFNVSPYDPFKLNSIGGDDNIQSKLSNSILLANNAVSDSDNNDDEEILLGIENPRFEISDFESSISVDEFLTFTVQALDSDGNNDEIYTGTIEFEVIDDENVTLPDDYEFEDVDAGRHTFSSGISFSTPGEKIVRLFDKTDGSIEAAFKVNVLASQTDDEDQEQSSLSITLDKPVSGISNQNSIEFSGTTAAGKEVKIFENNSLLISLGSDKDGKFQFISPPFADGDYEFFAEIDGVKSNVVELEIKTESAALNDFVIAPESVRPLKKFNLELTFSDRVSDVAVIIDGKKFDLENVDETGIKYFAELTSPVLSGEYNISVIYVDFQGASNTFLIPEKLFVLPAESSTILETDEIDFTSNPTDLDSSLDDIDQSTPQGNSFVSDAVFIPPSDVTGLTTISDTNKVQLNWISSTDNTGVAFYVIRFGLDPTNLNSEIRTFDSTNAFTIEQLAEGQEYYFSVYAVDLDGNLSRNGSSVVSAFTSRSVTSSFGLNVNNDNLLVNPDINNNLNVDPSLISNNTVDSNQDLNGLETSNVGPSENIAFVSLFLSFVIGIIIRRKNWLWF